MPDLDLTVKALDEHKLKVALAKANSAYPKLPDTPITLGKRPNLSHQVQVNNIILQQYFNQNKALKFTLLKVIQACISDPFNLQEGDDSESLLERIKLELPREAYKEIMKDVNYMMEGYGCFRQAHKNKRTLIQKLSVDNN